MACECDRCEVGGLVGETGRSGTLLRGAGDLWEDHARWLQVVSVFFFLVVFGDSLDVAGLAGRSRRILVAKGMRERAKQKNSPYLSRTASSAFSVCFFSTRILSFADVCNEDTFTTSLPRYILAIQHQLFYPPAKEKITRKFFQRWIKIVVVVVVLLSLLSTSFPLKPLISWCQA